MPSEPASPRFTQADIDELKAEIARLEDVEKTLRGEMNNKLQNTEAMGTHCLLFAHFARITLLLVYNL